MITKALIKILILTATDLSSTKPLKVPKISVSACLTDTPDTQSNQCKWKSTIANIVNDSATWNQSSLLAMEKGGGGGGSKILLQIHQEEEEDEVLAEGWYPMDGVVDFEKAEEVDCMLVPGGCLRIQVGLYGTDGTLRGSSKAVQVKHPYRTSKDFRKSNIFRNSVSLEGGTDFSRRGISHVQTTWGRAVSPQRRQVEKPTKMFMAAERGDSKRLHELERTMEEYTKRLKAKDAQITKLNDQLQEAKKQKETTIEEEEDIDDGTEILKLQLEQEVDELERQLEAKIARCGELEVVMKKYEGIDNDIRQLFAETQAPPVELKGEENVLEQRSVTSLKKTKDSNMIPDTPEGYATFLEKNENLEFLSEVKNKLSKSDAVWVTQFLAAGGLHNINLLLTKVEAKPNPDFPLMVREAQLTSCVRIMMNTQTSLLSILRDHRDAFSNFAKLSLLSKNSLVKAQMCMLLAGLCLYNPSTHKYVQGLVKFLAKSPRPYFALTKVLREERDTGLMTSCMCLVNAILAGEFELGARMRTLKQLMDAGIHTTMEKLEKQFKSERALILQFDAFREIQKKDQEKLRDLRYIGNIDLKNSEILFNRVMLQTSALNLDRLVLSILQNMLLIPVASDINNNQDQKTKVGLAFIDRMIRRVTFPTEVDVIGRMTDEEIQREAFKMIQLERLRPEEEDTPPPQKPEPSTTTTSDPTGAPTSPDPPLPASRRKQGLALPGLTPGDKDRQEVLQRAPKGGPTTEYWDKFKPDKDKLEKVLPRFEEKSNLPAHMQTKKAKIVILPTHIANNTSILRAQFRRMTDTDIISAILDVRNRPLTTEQLEALVKCVPTDENIIDALVSYEGNVEDLREAERFSLTLLTIDNVGNILQSLIFYDEFEGKASTIQHQLSIMKIACEEVLSSEKLQGLFGVILTMGNFLNYGQNLGKAKGIHLSTLGKLNQVRAANNTRYNLLDFLIDELEVNFTDLIDFYTQLPHLEEAIRYYPKLVKEEIVALGQGLERVLDQLEGTGDQLKIGAYADYYELMENFLDGASGLHQQLQSEWGNFVPDMNAVLTAFPNEGTLQPLLNTLYQFTKKFRDIVERRKLEQEEYDKYAKMGWLGSEDAPPEEEEGNNKPKVPKKLGIIDQLIEGVIRGDYGLTEEATSQFEYHEAKRQTKGGNSIVTSGSSGSTSGTLAKGETTTVDEIDTLLNSKDDFGFGESYADELVSYGAREDVAVAGVEDDLDNLLGGGGDLSGFTIDQLLG